MKTLNENPSININKKSNINVIFQLLNFKDCVNGLTPKFKKTLSEFYRTNKIDLIGAPIIFVKDGTMYKLSIISGRYSRTGRYFEQAHYLPIVGVGEKFKNLTKERFK